VMSPLRRPLLGRTRVHDMEVMATDTERSLPGSPKNRSGCRCRGPPCPDEPVGLMVRDHGRARGHIEVAGVPGNLVDAGIAQPVEAAGDRSPHLLANPPDGFPVGAQPRGWGSHAVPRTARRRHPRSRRRHLEVTGGASARDRLAERRSGQPSSSLRRMTVTTTLNPSKTRSMPVTLRKSMRRVKAVVTRTGSVSLARLVSRPRNERPPVRVAWTTGANAGPTCPAERRQTETDPHGCSPVSPVWSDRRNSRIAPADDPHSCRTTHDVPARGLSIETQLTISLDGLLLPR